jgi:methionyl-tRNA formyltransferase
MPFTPLKLIFAGSGEFGLPTLRALRSAGHDIRLVVSQPDRPSGRGRRLTPTPISQFAIKECLELLRTPDINSADLPAADLLVVIAFGQKIAEHVANAPRLGSINLHGSRLPRHRGAAPVHAAILAGDEITGNSVIRLADRMDAGAILGMSELPIHPTETAGELHDRLAEDGKHLVLRVLQELAEGRSVELEQDHSRATLARKLSRNSAVLDFSQPSTVVARTIRGLAPWPGCRVRLLDPAGNDRGTLTLHRAAAETDDSSATCAASPGTVLDDGTVSCGEGAIRVLELQPEGGRRLTLPEYRNGHPWARGMRLESVT